jgi:molybdopterin-synthase adenylyltransferase
MSFSEAELERYSRQLVMQEWSGEAQERLKQASVIVVGIGALGCPVATYLACAGVGRLGLVDGDEIALSNLHRQPLHYSPDVGQNKAYSAATKLGVINPEVIVEPFPAHVTTDNARPIFDGADIVVDCTDSFSTRYMINDACCGLQIPLVEAGVIGFSGLVLSIVPGQSACYRCTFPVDVSDSGLEACSEAGILGATASLVGSIQALEAIKLLGGVGEPLLDRLLEIDATDMTQTLIHTRRRPQCAACAACDATKSG